MTPLEEARQIAASHYPEAIEDTHGRAHRCIPRDSILSGKWDGGQLVRNALAAIEHKEIGR